MNDSITDLIYPENGSLGDGVKKNGRFRDAALFEFELIVWLVKKRF
ncbi:MAG: hypothetical protein JSR39_08330 [Verrucomicrobia bacterium]|nr:hypothetical protein [Verrucomicrobiota bacterium]